MGNKQNKNIKEESLTGKKMKGDKVYIFFPSSFTLRIIMKTYKEINETEGDRESTKFNRKEDEMGKERRGKGKEYQFLLVSLYLDNHGGKLVRERSETREVEEVNISGKR